MSFFNFSATFFSAIIGGSLAHSKNKTTVLGCALAYTLVGGVFLEILIPKSITPQSVICDSIIAMIAAQLCFNDSSKRWFRLAFEANYCFVIPLLVSGGIDIAYDKGIKNITIIVSGLIYSMGGEWLFATLGFTFISISSLVHNLIYAIAYIKFLVVMNSNFAKIIIILMGCTFFVITKHLNVMPLKLYYSKTIVAFKQHILLPTSLRLNTVVYIERHTYFHQVYNSTIGTKKLLFYRKLM